MGWDVALQALGGGLDGLARGFSWQQDMGERRRQFDVTAGMNQQEIDIRREELKAEIKAMFESLNKPPEDPIERIDTVDDDGNPATRFVPRSQVTNRAFPKYREPKAQPQEPLERVETVDERGNPATRFVPRSAASNQSFPRYREPKSMTAITQKDDPALPSGVRQYLSTFPQKYGRGQRDRALHELETTLQALYRDHPNLDANKVYQMFDRMFPAREDDVLIDDVVPPAPAIDPTTNLPSRAAGAGRDIRLPAHSSRPGQTAITPAKSIKELQQTPLRPPTAGRSSGAGSMGATPGLPPTMAVGSVVTLRDGRRVRVLAINPDGAWEAELVP